MVLWDATEHTEHCSKIQLNVVGLGRSNLHPYCVGTASKHRRYLHTCGEHWSQVFWYISTHIHDHS